MKIAEHICTKQNEDGAMVLDIQRGKLYGLNPAASAILELLGQGWDRGQIKTELSRRFSVDQDTVAKDVDEFLLKLQELEVIHAEETTPQSKPGQ